MSLKELIVAAKCRVGKSHGTTRRGAYWLACDPIKLRCTGGDGIGQNAADVTFWLHLRHYRSGEAQASIHRDAYHQNGTHGGGGDHWESVEQLLDCETVEEAVVALKGLRFGEYAEAVYSNNKEEGLRESLVALGMPETAPSPDEAASQV